MDCSQILPGAVNPGHCSLATGYFLNSPFIAFASGKDLVILDGRLRHLQTMLGSDCGYGDMRISCIHCAEYSGSIAVAWGSDVMIFEPQPLEDYSNRTRNDEFPGHWRPSHTLPHDSPINSLSLGREGTKVAVGGSHVTIWTFESIGRSSPYLTEPRPDAAAWQQIWHCRMSRPVELLQLSPDEAMLATSGPNDCLVRVWYHPRTDGGGIKGDGVSYSFLYVSHPQSVTGFVWRKTSAFMPPGSVPNVLLTYCRDNICRLWSHSLSQKRNRLRFFIAASIDPYADIPFRSTMPIEGAPFIIHWLNNKETTFSSKAEKSRQSVFTPLSHHGSLASFASSINEEMLQSWVCIDEGKDADAHPHRVESTPDAVGGSAAKTPTSYSFSSFLGVSHQRGHQARSYSPGDDARGLGPQGKLHKHLMEEWCTTPDLLLCIHPTMGSLMVWTVEGLDALPGSTKLVHVSFSSCLPHVFPPHLAQSLKPELKQFLIREPDVVQVHDPVSGSVSDISLPVPQIKLPKSDNIAGSLSETAGGGRRSRNDNLKTKPDSTLVLVSSHVNGSINTWSVELTMQSKLYTSIAGLIHCGGTGGHHSEVRKVLRHPWLPVLMTVSSDVSDGAGKGEGGEERGNGVESELIIWNASLPGPLEHKSELHELSRMLCIDPQSFRHVTWVPPISAGREDEGVFARCPSSGLFVANVDRQLRLYQTNLYCVTKPQTGSGAPPPSSSAQFGGGAARDSDPCMAGLPTVTVTSHLGCDGISMVRVIEDDLSKYEEIVAVYAFRMCSLVTSFDIKKSLSSKFCRDIIVILIENRRIAGSAKSVRSHLHLWRVAVHGQTTMKELSPDWAAPATRPRSTSSGHLLQPVVYSATVEKVYCAAFPLPAGVSVVLSSQACDVSSSLQLQLPTLASPFIFTTACSEGTVRCWQFSVSAPSDSRSATPGLLTSPAGMDVRPAGLGLTEGLTFDLYEVVGTTRRGEVGSGVACLDCMEDEALKNLPTTSFIPSALASAYPGRFAMAHQLSRPIDPPQASKTSANPLDRYAAVSIWECESSGGLKWSCEATEMLSGLGVLTSQSKSAPMSILLEWLPMENGAYLLATCFASIISIFGMSLPEAGDQSSTTSSSSVEEPFRRPQKVATLKTECTHASWVCLLRFACCKPYTGLTISCFCYTGSNSLLLSIGSEMHLYSCWVQGSRLEASTPLSSEQRLVARNPSRVFRRESIQAGKLTADDTINMLDYAHARNTPLPQYHPKILLELMNSGKLHAVKMVLVNLVKFLLLYEKKKKKKKRRSYLYSLDEEEEEDSKRHRLLSVSNDGYLKRSRTVQAKTIVTSIPPLSISKLGIFKQRELVVEVAEEADASAVEQDDYDELFSTNLSSGVDELRYSFEEDAAKGITFADIDLETSDFTPKLAERLSSLLHVAQLVDLSDLEQVRLLAIAETVANTSVTFSGQAGAGSGQAPPAVQVLDESVYSLSTSTGAGYATAGLAHGVRGGEAMDDCGLRYLLALQNYITLSEALPSGVMHGALAPSDLVWAFHSDSESELLLAVPCVHKDILAWPELRNAGVGWWLRSADTLRRLSEKLAKAQFMKDQDPLDACLFYIAMRKKTLVKGLFRTVHDPKMMAFFSNNFSEERWRKAALKNAFSLLSKQRFEHAAAFFLLAGRLWDAVEVCLSRLHDTQLAFVITRLYEGDGGETYQRLLKECVLGIPVIGGKPVQQVEMSQDPFLRSMAHWLLQDYSAALETLLVTPTKRGVRRRGSVIVGREGREELDHSSSLHPSIFNFYFFLRSHPLLIRRDFISRGSKSLLQSQPRSAAAARAFGHPLSSVGEDPLTPAERSLLFSTAYYHLSHGCPLLALDVLSRLPKSCNLGAEACDVCAGSSSSSPDRLAMTLGQDVAASGAPASTDASMSGMILSGTLGDFSFSGRNRPGADTAGGGNDDFDWSQPVASQPGGAVSDDDFDWGQPASTQLGGGNKGRFGAIVEEEEEDNFDWSKSVSSQVSLSRGAEEEEEEDRNTSVCANENRPTSEASGAEDHERARGGEHPSTLSIQGLFILSLAEQLQYNACLSILTEELNTIHVLACCEHLWRNKGQRSLPILPLARTTSKQRSLVAHFHDNAFEKTVLSLRGRLIEWLSSETEIVKWICGFELARGEGTEEEVVAESLKPNSRPAGYDLLTTLMNYTSLHASTSPSLLATKLELMHLMNTLLPWGGGPSLETAGSDLSEFDTSAVSLCAVDPVQLPIFTSCSLPAKHLTNLALNLRLMCASVIENLVTHTCPPIASRRLPHAQEVFDLCCAISHSLTLCLCPMKLSELGISLHGPAVANSAPSQPDRHGGTARPPSDAAPSLTDLLRVLADTPNTKPSKWPGVGAWPHLLSSEEGKDPTPLSLVLVESCIAVYLGLLAVAWSAHSVSDILQLLKCVPSQDMWYQVFGGGADIKKSPGEGRRSRGRPRGGRTGQSLLMQKVEAMTKRIKLLRRGGSETKEAETHTGLFIAPKKTLLEFFLAVHPVSEDLTSIGEEEEEEEEEVDGEDTDGEEDMSYGAVTMEKGPTFRLGSVVEDETNHSLPDSFAWTLMNLCITHLVQEATRKILNTAGMEVLELVTASPLLYSALKVMDEWESIFARRLEALGRAPGDLFQTDEDQPVFVAGPALMKHKFILEPDNAPFKSHTREGRAAKQLWEYLVHRDESRETFLYYIFANKRIGCIDEEEPDVRILYKEPDGVISCFCVNSSNPSVMALAVSREVVEIDIPDNSCLDFLSLSDDSLDQVEPPKRSHSVASGAEEFIMVQSSSIIHKVSSLSSQLHHHQHSQSIPYAMHTQTGGTSSLLLKRPVAAVKRMAAHPTMAYYVTGALDGSVKMWEFGVPRPVAVMQQPGQGACITKMRFTPQGNKYGITDLSGKLHLWQGIHTSSKTPFQTLTSGMRYLADFLFLGSSSFVAACGDSSDNKNLFIWDTLLPSKKSIVREYTCLDGGATSLGYSPQKQRIFCGGRRGELCIFDTRQYTLLQCIPGVFAGAISSIAVSDVDGYLMAGSSDGDIKLFDLTTVSELASFPGDHAKSRLFRPEGGVTDMTLRPEGKLYSCGADGTIKCRTLHF